MAPLIELKQITRSFVTGAIETVVLKNIDIAITAGEFVAIVGPSGSGKSSTMNIIGLLDTPSVGQYLINGKNVSDLTPDEQSVIRSRDIGFVFQSFNLLPRKTVFDNVALPLLYRNDIPHKERHAHIVASLLKAELDESLWNKKVNVISGGQCQRVAIARALVGKPKIILADEPTGNLDSLTGKNVLAMLRRLNEQEGITIVVVTHDDSVARATRRTIRIVDGSIESDTLNYESI